MYFDLFFPYLKYVIEYDQMFCKVLFLWTCTLSDVVNCVFSVDVYAIRYCGKYVSSVRVFYNMLWNVRFL